MTAAVVPRRPPADPRLLRRCLLLAVLLHVWLVLLFGNATGTAAPGQGVWGSLTVKLLGRSGAAPQALPGATTQPARERAAEAAEAAKASTAATTGAPTLALPEGFKPVEPQALAAPAGRLAARESPVLPLAPALAPLAAATAATLPSADLPAALGRLESRPEATPVPLQSAAGLRALAHPGVELPALPSGLPASVQRLEAQAEAGVAPLARSAELALPRAAAPLAANAELPAAVQRLEAPAAAAAVTALPRAAGLSPATAAPAGSTPSAQDLPAPVRRLESAEPGEGGAGAAVTPLRPAAERAPAPPAQALPELSSALPGTVAGPAQGDPFAPPLAGSRADAGARPGLPAPPSAAASAPPAPLNLSLPRGDMTARRGPGLVELLPAPPERKSKLEKSLDDAAAKDCRTAYGGAGILAAVPLALDAVRGKGCKW